MDERPRVVELGDWVPDHGFRNLQLGNKLKDVSQRYRLVDDGVDPYTQSHRFAIEELDCDVYFQGGRVESVNCYRSCRYRGKELMDLSIDEIRALLEEEPIDIDFIRLDTDPSGQHVFTFDKTGMQIWIKSTGEVSNIICSSAPE